MFPTLSHNALTNCLLSSFLLKTLRPNKVDTCPRHTGTGLALHLGLTPAVEPELLACSSPPTVSSVASRPRSNPRRGKGRTGEEGELLPQATHA